MCIALDEQGDSRLLDILDAADRANEAAKDEQRVQAGEQNPQHELTRAERFGRPATREADPARDQERA